MLCWAQGISVIYFSTASWFWTTCLSYCMYSIIRSGHSQIKDVYLHVLCWGLPLLLSLLPLVDATYGTDSSGTQWCLITSNERSSYYTTEMWSYLAYFGWLILCIFLMSFWYLRVRRQIRGKSDALSTLVRTTYQRVSWYPVVMISCWSLNFVTIEFTAHVSNNLAGLSMLCGVSYGTLTALVFFIKSEEARGRWYEFFASQEWLWGYLKLRPSTSSIPIDFADDDFNHPFMLSDAFSADSKSTVNTANNNNNAGLDAGNDAAECRQSSTNPLTSDLIAAAAATTTTLSLSSATHNQHNTNNINRNRSSKLSLSGRQSLSAAGLVAGMSSANENSVSSQWTGSSIFTLSEHQSTVESSISSDQNEFNIL